VLLRTDVVRRVGGFDGRLSLRADWDLWIRIAGEGLAAACPEILAGYTVHDTNMHIVAIDDFGPELAYLAAKHRPLALRLGVPFGRRAQLKWTAISNRRAGRYGRAAWAYLRLGLRYRQPSDLGRAAAVLFGERAMRRVRVPVPPSSLIEPCWLRLYR
jgi:hypothetical protein